MKEERITEGSSWIDPRGQVMKTPDDVADVKAGYRVLFNKGGRYGRGSTRCQTPSGKRCGST